MKIDDAEAVILTTMMKNPHKRGRITSIVTEPLDFFCREETKEIYKVICDMDKEGIDIHPESIGLFGPVNTIKVKEIFDNYEEIPDNNIPRVLALIRDTSLQVDFKTKYLMDMNTVLTDGSLSVKTKADKIRGLLDIIKDRSTPMVSNFKSIGSVATEHLKILEERKTGINHHSTGDFRLDQLLTYGFYPGESTIVGGRPGNGKSFYTLHLERLLGNIGIKTAVFNQEMANAATMDRILSMSARIDANKLIKFTKDLDEEEMGRISREISRLNEGIPIFFNETTSLTLDDCEKEICNIQEASQTEYMVVFWDLFTKLKDFQKATSAMDIEKICNRLQAMYKRLRIHAVPILQINRDSDKEKLKTLRDVSKIYPSPSNIKNSDSFYEIADNMLLVCRPSAYLRRYEWGSFVPHYTRVEVAKQRGPGADMDPVLLYKNLTEYMALVIPEEGWDPLTIEIEE